MPDLTDQQRKEVAAVLRAINDAWLKHRPQDISQFLHDDIVMVFPGFAGRAAGKSEVVAGYQEFSDTAEVTSSEESDLHIDIYDKTAVASYAYEIVYVRNSEAWRATGRDLFVLSKGSGRWLAVWRAMLDLAEARVNQ